MENPPTDATRASNLPVTSQGSRSNRPAGWEVLSLQLAVRTCPDSVVGRLLASGADVSAVHDQNEVLSCAAGREVEAAAILERLAQAGAAFLDSAGPAADKLLGGPLSFFAALQGYKGSDHVYRLLWEGPGGCVTFVL